MSGAIPEQRIAAIQTADKIFISYRRDDSRYQARIIYNAFCAVLPRERLFMDIDTIPPGADFVEVLEQWVAQSETMLVLIGPGWVNAIDPKTGRKRLDNPNDFVRIEVGAALSSGIRVVPVLIDGARVPEPHQLPDDLKKLARRQAEVVEFRTFDSDVARLMGKLGLRTRRSVTPARTEDRGAPSHDLVDPLSELAQLIGRHDRVDPLDTLSVDLALMIDDEAVTEFWKRYQRGEHNLGGRPLYTTEGQNAFEEIRSKYRSDPEFRQTVERYIHEFDRLLDDVSRSHSGDAAVLNYLTSSTGKVYVMLAHAAGRFDN